MIYLFIPLDFNICINMNYMNMNICINELYLKII